MSLSELKRQARAGNKDAKKVYPVRAFRMHLWIILWTILGFLISCIVLLLHALVGSFWTIIVNIPLVVLIHAVLPWTKRPKPSLRLAAFVSPIFEKMLRFFFPVMHHIEKMIGRWVQPEPILLIQSKDELLEILSHNAEEFDHVSKDELKIAENALIFGDKLIGEYMTPLNAVHFVKLDDPLSPVVLGELHDSGHSRFPVYQGNVQNIVGTLMLKDALNASNHKSVKDIMHSEAYYINEQQTLDYALNGFIKTKHHLFIVVNEFEDIVGVLSIDDVIEQIIGKQINDEFDQFDDLRAVAKANAKSKQQERAEV